MADHFLAGDPPIALLLRRSSRARRISLRISQLDGRVTLTLPNYVSDQEALHFANSKESWVRQHLASRGDDVIVAEGVQLPIEGKLRIVALDQGRLVSLSHDTLTVPRNRPGPAAQAYLKALARDRLAGASDHYAAKLGQGYTRITLRDTRSRWGSCSAAGALMYSWRLILAPSAVLNYVAAHEVAHLREMNHSAAFWNLVETLHGPYDAPRTWLRNEGAGLHRYRF